MTKRLGMVVVLLAAVTASATQVCAFVGSAGPGPAPLKMVVSPTPPGRHAEEAGPAAPGKVAALQSSAAWQRFASTAVGWSAQWNALTGTPRFATGPAIGIPGFAKLTRDNIKQACAAFISANADLLCADPSRLRLVSATNAGGRWYVTYQQTVGGVPVLGGQVKLSFTLDDRLITFGSGVFPGAMVNTTPALDAKAALAAAVSDLGGVGPNDRISAPELVVFPSTRSGALEYALCWRLDILQRGAHKRWQYLVDAHTGEIADKRDILWYGSVTGTVQGEYRPEFPNDATQTDLVRYCNVSAEGPEVVVTSWDFDTNPGWTLEGQWQYGKPNGGGSYGKDPTAGHTGTNVIGYNLNGDYPNNMTTTQYATTPAIDCTGRANVRLRFYRWLGVEDSYWDKASIQASNNGTTWVNVWQHNGGSISDTAWSYVDYDLSAVADNKATVYIRFGMGPTDSSVTYPGWNIDDVRIVSIQGGLSSGRTGVDGAYSVLLPWEPSTVTSKLEGLYCDIDNGAGGDSWFIRTGVAPDALLDWTWDSTIYGRIDEPSVYRHVNYVHDYYKSLDPAFNRLDYSMPTLVAIPNYANAYWDGTGMAFGAGDGINYLSFGLSSEIVYHEYTHGVTDKIYTGIDFPYSGEPGAMNEAWSDYWGCLLSLSQTPKVGDGGVIVSMPNGFRTLDNNYRRETDWYGEVHEDSQMFSGALWEARTVLGGAIMDPLVHFARYAHGDTFEEMVLAILVEDDVRYGDNNLANGTPHGEVIYSKFARHGIGGLRYSTGSLVIDDSRGNGNGKLDPGETVNVSLSLVNGWANAANVHATLSTTDPHVTVTKNTAAFPSAGHGAVVNNASDTFTLAVRSDCPETHTVDFTLQITADGPYAYTRTSLLYSTVAVGQIAYDDGGADTYVGVYPKDGLAVRFTPEAYPCYPTHIRLFPYDMRTVTVGIWDDNGANGSPGTLLKSMSVTPQVSGGWYDVDITSHNIAVESGSIYVGWIGTETYYANGWDVDPPDAGRMWYYSDWSKSWMLADSNLMIRVRFLPGSTAGQAKGAPDGSVVSCVARAVTAVFDDCFYIEEMDRSSGIRVEKANHGLVVGRRATVTGIVHTNSRGERCISATKIHQSGLGVVEPVGVTNADLGGGPFGSQGCIWRWKWVLDAGSPPSYEMRPSTGLNNIGLLVRTWGVVTAWGRDWFYIDDGSRIEDGTGIVGIYVSAPGMVAPETGSIVAVTGISSCEYYNGKLVNVLLPRAQADIVVHSGPGPGGGTRLRAAPDKPSPRAGQSDAVVGR